MEYPNNSNDYKKSEKSTDIQKVTKNPVKVKRRFKDLIIAQDPREVGENVLFNVIIPGVKKVISDAFDNTIHMIFGTSSSSASSYTYSKKPSDYTSYSNCSERASSKPIYNYGINKPSDVTFETKEEADEALAKLRAAIEADEWVSVASYYHIAGVRQELIKYTDQYHGWVNLKNADVVYFRDKWFIDLPEPVGK